MHQDDNAKIEALEEEYFALLRPVSKREHWRLRPSFGRSKEDQPRIRELAKRLKSLQLPHYFLWCELEYGEYGDCRPCACDFIQETLALVRVDNLTAENADIICSVAAFPWKDRFIGYDHESESMYGRYGTATISCLTYILSNFPLDDRFFVPEGQIPIFKLFSGFDDAFREIHLWNSEHTFEGIVNCERELRGKWSRLIDELDKKSRANEMRIRNLTSQPVSPGDKFLLNVLRFAKQQADEQHSSSMNSTNLKLIPQSFEDKPIANNDLPQVHSAASGKGNRSTIPHEIYGVTEEIEPAEEPLGVVLKNPQDIVNPLVERFDKFEQSLPNFITYRAPGETDAERWDRISRDRYEGKGWTEIAKLEDVTGKTEIEKKANAISHAVSRYRKENPEK